MLRRRGIVRIVITLLLIYALLCFARSGRSLAALEKTAADLREQRISLEQQRAQLQLLQQADPARMEALAREDLGMVMPGEIVFLFADSKQADSEQTERNPLWLWK